MHITHPAFISSHPRARRATMVHPACAPSGGKRPSRTSREGTIAVGLPALVRRPDETGIINRHVAQVVPMASRRGQGRSADPRDCNPLITPDDAQIWASDTFQ